MAHEGFKAIAKKTSPALAAYLGRKLYGKKKFQQAAAEGKPLKVNQRLPKFKGKKANASAPNMPRYQGK